MNPEYSTLLTDVCQLTIFQGYWRHGMQETTNLDTRATLSALSPRNTHFVIRSHLQRACRSRLRGRQKIFQNAGERRSVRSFALTVKLVVVLTDLTPESDATVAASRVALELRSLRSTIVTRLIATTDLSVTPRSLLRSSRICS
jgi:hypothetical protein